MDADHVLRTTRSVRLRLDFDRPIDPAVIEECLEIALQAPTAPNSQHWPRVVVTEPAPTAAVAAVYRKSFAVLAAPPPAERPADPAPGPAQLVDRKAVLDLLHRYTDPGLTERQRRALLAVGIYGMPLEEVVILATGSQGEPTSALTRIAEGRHRDIEITAGDTVAVSASPIPGNETAVARTIDNLMRQGAHVLYSRISTVHVHGHAAREQLKMMLSVVKPRFFVPVHGERRHLVHHIGIAEDMGVPAERAFALEDGDVLELRRSARADLYDLFQNAPAVLVPRRRRFGPVCGGSISSGMARPPAMPASSCRARSAG